MPNTRRTLRSILVALLVAIMTFNPATACHYCGSYGGGYYGGGYYNSGYYSGGYYEPAYYDTCCGGEVIVSDSCDGCSDCGGCGSSCGCGSCDGCVGCEACGGQGEAVYEQAPSEVEAPMAAPEPAAQEEMPSTVNRPAAEPEPPQVPQPMPSTTDSEMEAMPPALPGLEEPAPLPGTTTPPADTINDLFGEPAATTPAVEPTPPAETTDDLFGEPAAEPPLPAEEPSTPAESNDLFGEPAAETTPAEEPASEPSGDDLFGTPAVEEAPATEETPAEEKTAPDEEKTDDSDLFGDAGAILELPGGLASHALRRWVDDTGNFSCRGRLIRFLDGKVQLLKDNGRTTTVPLARLSQGDLEFVNRQASAQKAEAVGKTAQAATAWSN